ncbi:SRPBCC family protein [Streptomyces populi]
MQVIKGKGLQIMEWTGEVYADTPAVSARTYVDVPPERLWGYVSDIHLMPGLSAELQHVEWLDGATGPRPGNRFLGRSAHEDLGNWETVSTVIDCQEPQRFSWAVGDPLRAPAGPPGRGAPGPPAG